VLVTSFVPLIPRNNPFYCDLNCNAGRSQFRSHMTTQWLIVTSRHIRVFALNSYSIVRPKTVSVVSQLFTVRLSYCHLILCCLSVCLLFCIATSLWKASASKQALKRDGPQSIRLFSRIIAILSHCFLANYN